MTRRAWTSTIVARSAAWLGLAYGLGLTVLVVAGPLRVAPLQLEGSALLGDPAGLLDALALRSDTLRLVAIADSGFTFCYAVAFLGLARGLGSAGLVPLVASLVAIDLLENALSGLLAGPAASIELLARHAALTDVKWVASALVFAALGAATAARDRGLALFATGYGLVVLLGFATSTDALLLARGPLAALSLWPVARALSLEAEG